MTLKITLTIDQDAGADLVGLIAKAFGRGELGIDEVRIERDGVRVAYTAKEPVKLRMIRKSTVAKMIAAKTPKMRRDFMSKGKGSILALTSHATRSSCAHTGRRLRHACGCEQRARPRTVGKRKVDDLSEERCAAYFSRRVPRPIFLARSERARA